MTRSRFEFIVGPNLQKRWRSLEYAMTDVSEVFAGLPGLLDANSGLLRAGRRLSVDCVLGPADQPFLVCIRAGRIAEMSAMPRTMPSWRFGYIASVKAWIEYWDPEPKPGWHDLLALTKRGEAQLVGDLHPFMTHLQYFKDVLALPRGSIA
jgi:hypothetical protein